MRHQDIRHKLSEYLDDAVSPEERSLIESHLAVCAECSNALRELRKTIEHIRAVEEIEPPAWLAQKVMARVREEAPQRGILQALRDHFVMWRPVRVLAVLALTVTAYYVYLNIGPAGRFPAPPAETVSEERSASKGATDTKGRAVGGTDDERRHVPDRSAGRTAPSPKEALPQSPAYRSLDMRYSYERPSPPEPAASAADGAGPMLAKKSSVPSKTEAGAPGATAPPAAAPLAERSRENADRSEAEATAARQAPLRLTLETADVASAAAQSAKTVTDLGGKIVKFDIVTNANTITADIPTDALEDLIKRLRRLGTVRGLPAPTSPGQPRTLLELMVLSPSSRQEPEIR